MRSIMLHKTLTVWCALRIDERRLFIVIVEFNSGTQALA